VLYFDWCLFYCQTVHGYVEQVLLMSSVNLLLFWFIYGVILSSRSAVFSEILCVLSRVLFD
jgi:hypothetical protein